MSQLPSRYRQHLRQEQFRQEQWEELVVVAEQSVGEIEMMAREGSEFLGSLADHQSATARETRGTTPEMAEHSEMAELISLTFEKTHECHRQLFEANEVIRRGVETAKRYLIELAAERPQRLLHQVRANMITSAEDLVDRSTLSAVPPHAVPEARAAEPDTGGWRFIEYAAVPEPESAR
jgi:hypothetical protein